MPVSNRFPRRGELGSNGLTFGGRGVAVGQIEVNPIINIENVTAGGIEGEANPPVEASVRDDQIIARGQPGIRARVGGTITAKVSS